MWTGRRCAPTTWSCRKTTTWASRRACTLAHAQPALAALPLNQFSGYREPGRVNLNTVSDQRVWEATVLRGGTATTGTSTVSSGSIPTAWTT